MFRSCAGWTLTGVFADGVYKSGFATSQEAYELNVVPLFKSLDRLEKILEGKDYLVGGKLTEADVRLYTTIVSGLRALSCIWRFDLTWSLLRCALILSTLVISSVTSERFDTTTRTSTGRLYSLVEYEFRNHFCASRWMKNLYWKNDAFKSTTDFDHIKTHYYWSHPQVNLKP